MTPARTLRPDELSTLTALLGVDFPGVEELRAQLENVTVTGRCSCGCPTIYLSVTSTTPAPVRSCVPVEATALAPSGKAAGLVLLFVDDGLLSTLEYAPLTDAAPHEFPPATLLIGVTPDIDDSDEDLRR